MQVRVYSRAYGSLRSLLLLLLILYGFFPQTIQAQTELNDKDLVQALRDAMPMDIKSTAALEAEVLSRGMQVHSHLMPAKHPIQMSEQELAMEHKLASIRARLRADRDNALLKSGLVVHEWGSFFFLQNHRGAGIGQFSNDPSDLPDFAEIWSEQPLRAIEMVIKPIIYFYPADTEGQSVSVRIRMPVGIPTQWYPQVNHFKPLRPQEGQTIPKDYPPLQHGELFWKNVMLSKAGKLSMPKVSDEHPWWHAAREVDAADLNTNGQNEKFLFYRGMNNANALVKIQSMENGAYVVSNASKHTLEHLIMLHVYEGKALYRYLPAIQPGASHTFEMLLTDEASELKTALPKAIDFWAETLQVSGLFPKEAEGLKKIWGQEFLGDEGVRLLHVMPQPVIDRTLALEIKPSPANIQRVMIARIECATPYIKPEIDKAVKALGDANQEVRVAAEEKLRQLTPFGEAYLRSKLNSVESMEAQERIEMILQDYDQRRRRYGAE